MEIWLVREIKKTLPSIKTTKIKDKTLFFLQLCKRYNIKMFNKG